MPRTDQRSSRHPRRGFTLVELIVAGLLVTFVWGTITMSLGQLGKAKRAGKRNLEAHMRADAAMHMIRREISSVIRDVDLFWTRLLLEDVSVRSDDGTSTATSCSSSTPG